jgi:hypothetical protein
MGSVQYFGYFCHGLLTGDPCTVETTEYVTVAGVCTEMGHCVTPQRGFRFRQLSCLGNMNMDRDKERGINSARNKGMNMKKDPVPDLVKTVEAMNVKYDRNENNELHYGRGVNDNMNYVDEDDNMNHKDMRKDMHKNRDTNKANHRNQNTDAWRYILRRNKQGLRNTEPVKIVEQENIDQSKKKVAAKNPDSIASVTSGNCKGLYNPSAYTRLVNICRDCFNIYKDPEVYSLCMGGCFDSQYFMHCAKTLLVEEQSFKTLIAQVGK